MRIYVHMRDSREMHLTRSRLYLSNPPQITHVGLDKSVLIFKTINLTQILIVDHVGDSLQLLL